MSENHAAQIRDLLNKESLEQPKVLLVEDSQFDMTLIKTLLEEYFPLTLIDHAPTRIDGLRLLKCEQYDVILLDLYLPASISLKDIQDFRDLAADDRVERDAGEVQRDFLSRQARGNVELGVVPGVAVELDALVFEVVVGADGSPVAVALAVQLPSLSVAPGHCGTFHIIA